MPEITMARGASQTGARHRRSPDQKRLKGVFILLACCWSAAAGGFALREYLRSYGMALELARTDCRSAYNKDLVYRRWATMHGGVYVPVTAKTPANPYLAHIPERDISTPAGRQLTLMNPAYMSRQVYEIASEQYGIRGHITSLKPIRPENAPDDWERKALQAFATGSAEVSSVEIMGQEPFMRLMRPMLTEKGCLKCHGQQGYQEGEIRGGISVSVPLTPFTDTVFTQLKDVILAIVCGWALGLAGLLISGRQLKKALAAREQAEEQLRLLNEGLERRVQERTAELEEKSKEIEQANIQLQGLDRLKSLFIASMSHELRTPLNSIIGFSSILGAEWLGQLTAEQKEKLGIILRAGKHLLALINDVIDVSKVESGCLERVEEDFDLPGLIAEAVALLQQDMTGKGLALELSSQPLRLRTDRRRLLQCLVNLLSNAIKYSETGTISITTEVMPVEGAAQLEERLAIRVRDTGIGIRPDDMAKLFTPFGRIPSARSVSIPGTGLGLYLVKKITTEILRGEIDATSRVGVGSTFCLTLPLRRV